jgi:hypothetical protein
MPRKSTTSHLGPPLSRGAAPLDSDVIAELRAECDATSQAEVGRQAGVSPSVISRALRSEKISKPAQDALIARTRRPQ